MFGLMGSSSRSRSVIDRRTGRLRLAGLLAIGVTGAMVVAACGSSGSGGAAGSASGSSPSSPPASASAGAQPSTSGAAGSSPSSGAGSSPSSAAAAGGKRIDLVFWSASSGSNGQAIQHLTDEFNASQSTYKVTAIYKGSYDTTMSDTIAAFQAHKAPDIAMIFDAGTNTFMSSNGAYMPVYQLMKKYNIPFSTSDFIGGAGSYYETADNKLDSMPFNSSAPVFYYNKALMSKAGITKPPTTWAELQADAPKLVASGTKCVYSMSGAYIMWTELEQFATWNAYQFASQNNGYDSIKGVKLDIASAPFVKHVQMLGNLAQKGEVLWSGVNTSTVPLFTSGKCAFYTNSSGDIAKITAGSKFPFGVGPMLTVAGNSKAPQNAIVGGASLWVMAGAPESHYKGDAEYLHFMMSDTAQEYWASHTGYVPVTNSASKALESQGFYKKNPADKVAVDELTNKPALPYTRGIRLGFLPKIRTAEVSAFSAVFSGKQTAQQALTAAAQQGDQILSQFASQYGH